MERTTWLTAHRDRHRMPLTLIHQCSTDGDEIVLGTSYDAIYFIERGYKLWCLDCGCDQGKHNLRSPTLSASGV